MTRLLAADHRVLPGLAGLFVLLGLATASAQPARPPPPPASDAIVAAELFDLGRERMADGDPAAACAAFIESQRLAPAVGTQLNLVVCLERRGRLVDALAVARDAAVAAQTAGDTRVSTAREWITRLEAEIEAKLPPPEPPPAAVAEPPPAAVSSAITAPVALTSPPPARRASYRPSVALGLGAAAVLAGSIALRIDAGERQALAETLCPSNPCSTDPARATALSASASTRSRIAVAGMIGSGVLAAAATVWWWRARDRERARAVHVELGPTAVALGYRGSF